MRDRDAPGKVLVSALFLTAACLLGTSTEAQESQRKNRFNPELSVAAGVTDNVNYVGEGSSQSSDNAARVEVLLPWTKSGRRTDIDLWYRARYTAFQSSSALDHMAHRLRFSLDRSYGRGSNFFIYLSAARTQDQGDPYGGDDTDNSLADRSWRDFVRAGIGFNQSLGRRWRWGLAGDAGRSWFTSIDGYVPPPGTGLIPTEDRQLYRLRTNLDHMISSRTQLGGYMSAEYIDYEDTGDQKLFRFGVEWNHQKTQVLGFISRFGAYLRDRETIAGQPEDEQFDRYGLELGFVLDYQKAVGTVVLQFDVGVTPSPGGILPGSSTNFRTGVRASNERSRSRWKWTTALRYDYRIPSDSRQPDVQTFSLGGSIEREFGRKAGLRLWARHTGQTDDGTGGADGTVNRAGISFVWYPIGGSRLAGGSS